MATVLEHPSLVLNSDDEDGRHPTVDDIQEALEKQPKPNRVTDYNVEEAAFWRTRHLPAGSVIEFQDPETPEEELPPLVALLVLGTVSRDTGIWVEVKVLGSESAAEKKKAEKYFKDGRHRVHICYPSAEGGCPLDEEAGLHLRKFRWYPPGELEAEWLNATARKAIAKGKEMELEELKKKRKDPRSPTGGAGRGAPLGETPVEKRLSALRARRVSFAEPVVSPGTARADSPREPRAGAGGRPAASASQALVPLKKVKEEVQTIDSETDQEEVKKTKKKKKKTLGDTLAKAARLRNAVEERSEKKKKRRSRSRSRSRRRRHKKKENSTDSDSERSSRGRSSSGDESLMAPLRKRSQRSPGSVYKMLEELAVERLSVDGVVEEGYEALGLRGQRPKILTYFQLVLKPQMDSKGRDCKELAMLARSLDLLRDGRLAELADVMAARLMAIHTATKQGWQTARHLEVFAEEDDSAAPPHVLLSAQRHARQVEKAGGKGSWPSRSPWQGGEWAYDNRPRGKGKEQKGKGKKGKGKGKGQKGQWSAWVDQGERGGGDKSKKAEAEG